MKCIGCGRKMMFLEKVGKESADWRKKKLKQLGIYRKCRGKARIYGCWEEESFAIVPTQKRDYLFWIEGDTKGAGRAKEMV